MLHHVRLLGKSFSTGWTFVRFDSCNLSGFDSLLQIVRSFEVVDKRERERKRNNEEKNRITGRHK